MKLLGKFLVRWGWRCGVMNYQLAYRRCLSKNVITQSFYSSITKKKKTRKLRSFIQYSSLKKQLGRGEKTHRFFIKKKKPSPILENPRTPVHWREDFFCENKSRWETCVAWGSNACRRFAQLHTRPAELHALLSTVHSGCANSEIWMTRVNSYAWGRTSEVYLLTLDWTVNWLR
jgi:hypothetical protein